MARQTHSAIPAETSSASPARSNSASPTSSNPRRAGVIDADARGGRAADAQREPSAANVAGDADAGEFPLWNFADGVAVCFGVWSDERAAGSGRELSDKHGIHERDAGSEQSAGGSERKRRASGEGV